MLTHVFNSHSELMQMLTFTWSRGRRFASLSRDISRLAVSWYTPLYRTTYRPERTLKSFPRTNVPEWSPCVKTKNPTKSRGGQ